MATGAEVKDKDTTATQTCILLQLYFILAIFRHVGNDQKWPLEVSSMHQTIKGDPRDGWDEL